MAADASAARTIKRERLAQRRKALGLTQEALAQQLGVERSTVIRWEHGDSEPLPLMRLKLARALRVSADRLGELLDNSGALGPGGNRNGPVAAAPRQLPAVVADFTGRAAELQTLTRLLDQAGAGPPGTVVISAIGGTAGVGKTALALHWAHQVAHLFPDGQLHVNLRGFDPSGTPATPAMAIREFLDALGVPPERIPPTLDAQAGLYRHLLAERKMLVVLDNARDEQQVRPLLPASPASLVLITSRNQLGGLAAADGARLVSLDVLPHDEAVQLLAARVGASRAAAEPAVIDEIASLCAHLPLALAVAAARAAARPRFPLAALAAELRDSAGRLDALDSGDPMASVRAVFSWSYRQLSTDAARLFRLLGLHPGPDISVPGAASLAGCQPPQTRRLLDELTRDCLITEHVPGRYAFHDLLRAYAAAQARIDSQPDRDAATGRALDHYLHTAAAAHLARNPERDVVVLTAPRPGVTSEQITSRQQALAWFEAEQHVLVAAISLAARSGYDAHAWQLPWATTYILARRGPREWAATQGAALAAATRLGDATGQAVSSRLLATAIIRLGDHDRAVGHLADALALFRQLGSHLGEASIQNELAKLAVQQQRYADSLSHAEQALRLSRTAREKPEEARALNNTGWCHALLGDYRQARVFCQQALTLSTELGMPGVQYAAWDSLGYVEHQAGNFGEAAACYQRALSICRELGARYPEAVTATRLGDTRYAAGELRQARDAWQRALSIHDDLCHPDADKVRAKLASAGQCEHHQRRESD